MNLVHNILSPSGKPWVIHPAGQQPVNYTYDPVGNVTQVTSSCPWLNIQSFMETFTYNASAQLTFSSFCLRPSLPAFDSIQPRLFSVLTIGKQSLLAQRTFAAGEKNLSITPPVFIIRNPIPDNVIQINESTP